MGVLLVENVKNHEFVRPALYKSIVRVDDMTEMVALWNSRHPDVMVPNSLRRTIKDAIENKFNEYHFKKYEGKRNKVKLKDLIKLSHPKDVKGIFKKIIENKLPNIQTVSRDLASGKSANVVYEELLKSKKLGYMEGLKNIRNALQSGLSEEGVDLFCSFIENPVMIEKSKILPFRYYSAYKELQKVQDLDHFAREKVCASLEKAFMTSTKNVEIIQNNEKVAICLDDSGSMKTKLGKSPVPFEVGKVLTCAISVSVPKENCIAYQWNDTARRIQVKSSAFEMMDSLNAYGGGTNVAAPISDLLSNKIKVDKIIIFTDEQMYTTEGCRYKNFDQILAEYKQTVNPDVKVLFWNLLGYPKGSPVNTYTPNVSEISGYSDKMLQLFPMLFSNKEALIEEIEQYSLK
jgi:hypothetical protein